jgi:hypothetical protein
MNGLKLNEADLLTQYRKAKDIEIEHLLSQYGTSLAETREMFPQLTTAISERQKTTAFPTQPLFFTASEAADMGVGLQENWMLKFTPDKEQTGYGISLISPEKWEITEDNRYISPEGTEYSQADIQALLGVPTGGLETTTQALTIEDLTEEGKGLYQEYQEAGGELDVSGWLDLRERQQLETEQVFGAVFPEQDIQEVLEYMQENPEGFLADIREIGWTPETEALLQRLAPDITQEEMYQIFGRPPEVEESDRKNVLDAIRLSFTNIFRFQIPRGITSLIPQFFVSLLQEEPGATAWVVEGRTPEATIPLLDLETGETTIIKGKDVLIEDIAPEWLQEFTESYQPWVRETLINLQEKYNENKKQQLQWLLEHPELFPPEEWEGGLIEKFQAGEWDTLKNPAYWAYIAADSAAYTTAFMGTSLIVGAATGNPYIGMAAGFVLTTPAQIDDLYEDLIASGATQDQAIMLATPIGAIINSVELWGDLPALRAISPVFARAFTQNIKTQLVNMTWRQLVAKGLKTFTEIEVFEISEEVLQAAMQNAIVSTFDENRWMFENIDETILRTLVATLPLALLGSGTQTARLYSYMNSEQKVQITETIENLTQNGVPRDQAELVALGQVLETPEGQVALSKVVDEVSQLPEVQRQAETALNEIQSTNPDLIVPAGGDMGLGIKAPSMPTSEDPEILFQVPSNEEIQKGLLIPNWIRSVLEKTAEIPVIGKIQKAILGWRSSLDIGSQITEDIVGRMAVTYQAINKMGTNTAKVETATLKSIVGNSVRYFGFNESGYSAKMAGRLLPDYAGEANAGTVEHVLTYPEMYDWTNMSRGLDYVTRFNRIQKAIFALLQKEGVAPNVVNEAWMHRVVTGRLVEGEIVETRGKPGRGGRAIGAKPSYEKPRTFKTMAEGIQAGFQYAPNPEASIGSYIEEAYKAIANGRVEEQLQEFGVTPSERLAERFPEVAERAELTKEELADAAQLHSVINRAIRGEKLPEQTLRAMERRFPELGAKLRSIIEGKPLNTIDEAAYQAEYGEKDAFDYPQQMPLETIDETKWNEMSVPERVAYVKALGLEGKVGSKAWANLTAEEREALSTQQTIKPKTEGIKGLEADTSSEEINLEAPKFDRKAELEALRKEAKTLVEARKAPYWQARAERAKAMEIVRQPGLEEGYIPMPFAGGRIFNQDFIDACNKFFGHEPGSAILKFTSDAASILRITKASLDFSAMMIQGLVSFGLAHAYMVVNPRIGAKLLGGWYKALFDSTRAFFTPGVFYDYMAKSEDAALQRVSFGGSSRAIDYFDVLRGRHGLAGIASWALGKLPLSPFERAELAFYSAGEIARNEFWKALSPKALKQGKGFELARSLDLMTGLAEAQAMGVPLTMRQLESSIMWFAPNYTRACLSLVADIFRGGYTGAFARKALGGMMAAGVAYYVGIQLAMSLLSGKDDDDAWRDILEGLGIQEDPITGEVTWKPTSRFLTIKVGNYFFGPGGFWYGLVRLMGNISSCINEVGDKERIDLVRILKNGSINRDNPFVYWWYTRASPLVGTGLELASGKDFLGYPMETPAEYLWYILRRFEPIWMEQGLNWMVPGATRDYEIPEGAARAAVPAFEIFGWRTFPESSWVKFYDKAQEYIKQIPFDELDEKQVDAWKEGTLGWGQLTHKQQQDLIQRYPNLAELYETAQNDSKLRQTKEWEAYTNRIDEERTIYYDRIDELTTRLQNGEIDTTTYRDLCSEAGQNYGAIMEAMERDPTYAEIYEYFNEKEAEGSKYEFRWDLAYAEYNSQIRFADDPGIYLPNGDYNWDEKDRRIAAFIEKWGEELYFEILDYISQAKEEKGLNPVWVRKSQDTEKLSREYWQLPYQPIKDMTDEDYAEGNIPDEYYSLWKKYQGLSDEDKEAFVELHPELAKDWRAEYRLANPEADAMLALWGYGGRLQSMEAYNLVRQWGDELGIPLSQMGLGLPPQNLIEDYFDYNKLGTQFSGNSAEAKLWRLEHPEFTDWAMESWGWEGTEDYKGIEYYQLQIKWRDTEAEYAQIEGTEERAQFLASHPDFRDDRNRMKAMDADFPETLIEDWVDWYAEDRSGYEDDWWLMEHEDFYNMMLEMGLWTEPRDFTKVPTREVWSLYQIYQGLPTGTPRLDFRAQHPELDAWLVLAFDLKPIGDRGNPEAEKTPWEEYGEVEQFQELFK